MNYHDGDFGLNFVQMGAHPFAFNWSTFDSDMRNSESQTESDEVNYIQNGLQQTQSTSDLMLTSTDWTGQVNPIPSNSAPSESQLGSLYASAALDHSQLNYGVFANQQS